MSRPVDKKKQPTPPEIKRQWSVVPVRALTDRNLTQIEFRVICALCIYTNSYGVCWPGVQTIGDVIGSDPAVISRAISKLVRKGYVRKLEPQDYQIEYAKFGRINRYQVLYQPDAPLPSWEEIKSSMILAPKADLPANHVNEQGSGDEQALVSLSHSLAHAYARAVTANTGQPVNIENVINHARALARDSVTVDQVQRATAETCKLALAKRAGVPSLADVARSIAACT